MNYYRRYIGDFQRDTGHLSLAEVGAYDRLLDHHYATERGLPEDYPSLFRICRAVTDEERAAVKAVADQFFPAKGDDGLRYNRRALKEIGIANVTIEKQRESGTATARRRWGSSTDAVQGRLTDADEDRSTDGVSVQPPTTNHQPPTTSSPTATGAFALPPWVPAGPWEGWMEVRRKLKAPNTERAMVLAIRDLDRLRKLGHEPAAVLEQSTTRGWRGLFEIKVGFNGAGGGQSERERRNQSVAEEFGKGGK